MNNNILCKILLSFFCISPIFAEDITVALSTIESFIANFVWYEKYLPIEKLPRVYSMYDGVIHAKENDRALFERIRIPLENENTEEEYGIPALEKIVFQNIDKRIEAVEPKMAALADFRKKNPEIHTLELQTLFEMHDSFKKNIAERKYPNDDSCFDDIEIHYSEHITRAPPPPDPVEEDIYFEYYTVKKGDYLTKIASYAFIYKDFRQWKRIYEANRDKFPNVRSAARIYPGMRLRIPRGTYYTVKRGDYLAKIAAYATIYNDYRGWRRIYEANRDLLPNPQNPALIYPGRRLRIPRWGIL
jgi:hypothetical protein